MIPANETLAGMPPMVMVTGVLVGAALEKICPAGVRNKPKTLYVGRMTKPDQRVHAAEQARADSRTRQTRRVFPIGWCLRGEVWQRGWGSAWAWQSVSGSSLRAAQIKSQGGRIWATAGAARRSLSPCRRLPRKPFLPWMPHDSAFSKVAMSCRTVRHLSELAMIASVAATSV